MAMLKINGAAIPAPSAMKLTIFETADVSRNAAGNAVMDLKAVKRKLELHWAHMDAAELAALLEAMHGFFEAEYPDAQTGEMRKIQCYCGDRASGILRMADGKPVWTDLKMIWTER